MVEKINETVKNPAENINPVKLDDTKDLNPEQLNEFVKGKFSQEEINSKMNEFLEKLDEFKDLNSEQSNEKSVENISQKDIKSEGDGVLNKQEDINNFRLTEDEKMKNYEKHLSYITEGEKTKIKEETGWSDEIIKHINSWGEYKIYKEAGLREVIINERPCLIKNIDLDYTDPKTGKTNRELMEEGRSPIDSKTGEKIEIHHMGQDPNAPFVELSESEHGDGNHSILHPNQENSWRNDKELNNEYNNKQKPEHWKERLNQL